MSENENALRLYHMAERKLKPHFKGGKIAGHCMAQGA